MSAKRIIYLALGVVVLLVLGLAPAVGAWAALPVGAPGGPGGPGGSPTMPADSGVAGVPLATPVPCIPPFGDVENSDYFYDAVRYLYCHGAVSGYDDGSFRPEEPVTRAQITKIVVLALNLPDYTPVQPTFEDVPPDNRFYEYIEAYTHYAGSCMGGCTLFNPYRETTRGQLAKIIVLASCWPIYVPPVPTFSDVDPQSTFYQYIETAYNAGAISGYADGTFRPYNNITRGQVSKVVYRAALLGPSCLSLSPTPGMK
jgi:hypothetical protein